MSAMVIGALVMAELKLMQGKPRLAVLWVAISCVALAGQVWVAAL